jgi:hypothetical protein
VTVTSARKNTNVPHVGARLPLPGCLVLGALQGKLDADLHTSASLGTPSVQSVHGYYPFALEDGGRLAPMAVELIDCLAIWVEVCRFPGMGVANSRLLRFVGCIHMQHFFRRSTCVLFLTFWGMCGENSCNVVLLLFMVLWVPIFARGHC